MSSIPDRDYLAEMAAAIEAAIPEGDYTAPLVAADLVDRLREEDPELLGGWLDLKAAVFLADVVARRSNSLRQSSRAMAPRRAFADAARSFGEGDAAALAPFAAEYVIDKAHTRRRVADMTGTDHRFVASSYADTKVTAALLEQFHLAVARKVGAKRTADVISEERYLRMYRSVVRRDPPEAGSAAA